MLAGPLIKYLEQLEAKGETHVVLDENARSILRTFYLRATQLQLPKDNSAGKQKKLTPPATKQQKASKPVALAKIEGSTFAEKLNSLKEVLASHPSLQSLGTLRPTLVFPDLPQSANIIFVGEAPGYHDERNKRPFSGPAGDKLDLILEAMGLSRPQVHITNILKFRPALEHQTTNNRPASPEELAASKPFMDKEIALLQPKVIITLGEGAARFFTGQSGDIDTIRQASYSYADIPLVNTFHPSFLLHNQDTADKRTLWEDMIKVMELMALPISAKQRSYFLPKTQEG
jgi:DNA polymerase